MSVKKDLYTAIKTALQGVEELKNVLHYNGQDTSDYENDHSKRFPQAWIQISDIEWKPSSQRPHESNQTQEQKTEIVNVTIYYASFSLSDDDDTFLTDLDNVDRIYRALTMLQGDNFNPLQRASEGDDSNNNNVRIWIQQYTTMLTENAVSLDRVDAAPVTLTINKD